MKMKYRQVGVPGAIGSYRVPVGYTFADGKSYLPNGARERSRRFGQIMAGTLKR